jgi:bifunctional non-homologous end joining protein LigD
MPVRWEEVESGIRPEDFTIFNALERIKKVGDIFEPLLDNKNAENLGAILHQIK